MSIEAKVYKILTKKKYNRDEPHLKKEIKEKIHSFIAANKPLKLVGFWGVGSKTKSNWADQESCKFLSKLNEEIKTIYPPGIEFTFIFSEVHGVHNGIEKKTSKKYILSIEELFKKYHFKWVYLKHLWEKYDISFEKIDEMLKKQHSNWWANIPHSKTLEKLAKQRNHRLPPQEAAQIYVLMRTLEKKLLEKEFADAIFHTFTGQAFDSLLPHMSRLHLYSYKQGRSNSPWFVTEEK